MVARSLSHVNPTASRNYVDTRDQKLAYNERANRLSAQISAINQQVNSATLRIGNLDSKIQALPSRIAQIRKSNFRVMTHLETDQATLSDEWLRLNPELRNTANLKGEVVRNQVRNLQQILTNKLRLPDYNVNSLQEIESAIPQLRSNLSEIQSSIANAMSPMEQKFETINQDVQQAENTLSLLQGASFPWEEGETPILAIKAKDLNSDLEGVITLTNLNFIFEQEKEIVLKKTLFVVTEKKTVREGAY
jgi:DNA repair exonuclease SbcCD ATPase subunit